MINANIIKSNCSCKLNNSVISDSIYDSNNETKMLKIRIIAREQKSSILEGRGILARAEARRGILRLSLLQLIISN
jgi:hypothetical protein